VYDYRLEDRTVGRILPDKAARLGDHPFLLWDNAIFSYADLEQWTNRYAHGFSASGIAKGDHVAVMMSNGPEFFWTIWGLAKIGAVVVPLNTAAKGDLLRYFLAQSDSIAVVVGAEWAGRIAEVAPLLPAVRLYLSPDIAAFTDQPATSPPVRVCHDDPAFIMYTSGTTGPSKGVVSPHAQAHAVGRHLTHHFAYASHDVLYTCLPLFHGNALWYTCYAALWADAAIALSPRFSVSGFWSEIKRMGATQFNALGAMTNLLLKQPPNSIERDHRVRQTMILPLTPQTYRDVSTRFGVQVTSLYAMTETFPVTIFIADDPAEKGASAGRPRGLADVAIMDDQDRKLPAGTVGEICVRPLEPWIMTTGYYKQPEATVSAFRNMWFHSGDRGILDEDGYLTFVDRTKEAIRRRGENISAFEVEMLISRHPDVMEVAAVPIAAELSEDEVMVFVVPRPGAAPTPESIVKFCDGIMPYFMVPRFVEIIESLPKTASEKIEKYKLKAAAEARRAELWDREAAGIPLTR
jgi:crotonobetaine/carnitine-CoA ligase